MMTKRDRTGDRRSTNLYRIDKYLRTNGVACQPEPRYLDGWTDRLLVGSRRSSPVDGARPSVAVNAVELDSVEFEVTTEPMQELDPDPDAAWIVRLHLPECCRQDHRSTTVDLDVDVLDGSTVVEKYGRTPHAAERILTYWRRHHDHRVPHPRSEELGEAASVRPSRQDRGETTHSQPSGPSSPPTSSGIPSRYDENTGQHAQNRTLYRVAVHEPNSGRGSVADRRALAP